MKVMSLDIRNFRTLESLTLIFPSSYTAISGANDSGKTNVVRAVRSLMREDSGEPSFGEDEDQLSLKKDFPKWSKADQAEQKIQIHVELSVHRDRDAGFYQFVVKHLSLTSPPEVLEIAILAIYGIGRKDPLVAVRIGEDTYSDLSAEEVLKKLQSSKSVLFYNSIQSDANYVYSGGSVAGTIREITGRHGSVVAAMKRTVNRGLAKISRKQQIEFEGLLGRLRTKYKVGLSMPAFDFSYTPFTITLGDTKYAVPLDDWGGGTKNRTLILLTLFRARQISESEASAGKITPVIIIEEPESFLHPSAQAEFGRVLQDLADEFQIQVIVTTHSPYLLNTKEPKANILLRRKMKFKQLRETEKVEISTENWMAPFAQTLGLNAEEFKPWKSLILGGTDAILLVEGDTDKEYFEMLRGDEHRENRLTFSGDIVTYDGTGNLENTVLLRFVKNRYDRLFVTFDLDAAGRLEKSLKALQLEKERHFLPVGLKGPGKQNIEGLLPERVTKAVYGANSDLVQAATSGTKDEQQSAKNKLKRLLLEEFKRVAKPGIEDYGHFYRITKAINKALRTL